MKLFRLIFVFINLGISVLQAQECPGGLGINLFTAGDFGSGESFVVENDPMLAPGYSYNRSGPPNDGQYMITNNVAEWSFVWDTWLVIGDNSPDPKGYMMVVNASFEPGLFYEEEIDGLCDNTTYEFSADIINMIKRGVTDHSDPNVVFLIDDEDVLNTGNIPKNERWNTYSFSFDTDPGQTSVKLSLRNNAPGGTGNDLALDNISFRACGPKSEIAVVDGSKSVCEEDLPVRLIAQLNGREEVDRRYQWEVRYDSGLRWEAIPGVENSQISYNELITSHPIFRFSTSASVASFDNEKCRFYSDTFSIRIFQREYEVFDTICGGTGLDFGNATLINPGLYIQELMSVQGCDSIVKIHLDTVKREVLSGIIEGQDPNCAGEATGTITAREISGGYAPYHLDIDGVDRNGLEVSGMPAGSYSILIKDRYNCFIASELMLTDPDQVTVDIGPDLELTLGQEATIEVNSNYPLDQIIWSGVDEDVQNQSSIRILPIFDGQIAVTGITEEGCTQHDSIFIRLDTDVSIYVPNVFSPNADQTNDEFYLSPFGKSLGQITYYTIYDRWGGTVYNYKSGNEKWDGRDQRGQPVSPGNYTFIMEGELINGTSFQESGTLLIIR